MWCCKDSAKPYTILTHTCMGGPSCCRLCHSISHTLVLQAGLWATEPSLISSSLPRFLSRSLVEAWEWGQQTQGAWAEYSLSHPHNSCNPCTSSTLQNPTMILTVYRVLAITSQKHVTKHFMTIVLNGSWMELVSNSWSLCNIHWIYTCSAITAL